MNELERMLIERECERLVYEYARLVDSGRASAIADLFTEDAVWEGTELRLDGRSEIRAWFTRREAVTRRVSRHVCTNVLVDVESPESARSSCALVNYRVDRAEGDRSLPVTAQLPKYMGDLHDTFRLTDAGWRFSSRQVEVVFVRRRA